MNARRKVLHGIWALTLAVIAIYAAVHFTKYHQLGKKALPIAAQQHGAQYRYRVVDVRWSGDHVSARLLAYNGKEEKYVVVEWQEQ